MSPSPLISAAELAQRLGDPTLRTRVVDCSFDLFDPNAGHQAFAQGHVPGAAYLHLDKDLSAPKTGLNGRHPLPDRAAFARSMATLGAQDDTLIVAYDRSGGTYAVRLWWMLRWAGHACVAVLDGGFQAWREAGFATDTAPAVPLAEGTAGLFSLRPSLAATVDLPTLRAQVDQGQGRVLDARAADRYRGENETLDPIGGRIPGARHRFFRDNLGPDGRFKPPAQLRAEFLEALGGWAPETVAHQCGSGVTACHNLLAMELAGLGGGALYAGSWSEWCAQPGAPIATGA